MAAPKAPVLGGAKKEVSLDASVFSAELKPGLIHETVRAELNAARAGTRGAKSRGLVAGGRSKPWRQKGTGRGRAGSSRQPNWVGGGVTHAPKPRSYAQKTPKKMVSLALRSALSDRAASERIAVVDAWNFDKPSTKSAIAALKDLGVEGRVLLVLGEDDEATWLSVRNLPEVHPILARELNAYDVLVSDWVVFTRETLPSSAPKPAETEVEIS